MSDSSQLTLKVVVIVHFVLSVWASMYFLGPSYIYMNAFILIFGAWAIISPDSIDAVFMFLILNVISIVLDAVFIGVFASLTTTSGEATLNANTYRFSLGMSILNLILKPCTSFLLYRIFQERRGEAIFPTFGFMESGHRSEYQPIGTSASAPYRPTHVETAAPHSTIEKDPSS